MDIYSKFSMNKEVEHNKRRLCLATFFLDLDTLYLVYNDRQKTIAYYDLGGLLNSLGIDIDLFRYELEKHKLEKTSIKDLESRLEVIPRGRSRLSVILGSVKRIKLSFNRIYDEIPKELQDKILPPNKNTSSSYFLNLYRENLYEVLENRNTSINYGMLSLIYELSVIKDMRLLFDAWLFCNMKTLPILVKELGLKVSVDFYQKAEMFKEDINKVIDNELINSNDIQFVKEIESILKLI